jgi:DNA polymerase/3'-5' exonuclease PolX
MLPETEVVGSVARKEGPVGDIDLLTTDRENLDRLATITEVIARGKDSREGEWVRVNYQGIPVGMLVVEPDNLATVRLWYSAGHRWNVCAKHFAKRSGWSYDWTGLRDCYGELLADNKEEICRLLDIKE